MNIARRPLIAGNWKMNAGGQDACSLATGVVEAARRSARVDVVICPPFTALAAAAHELWEAKSAVMLGAQNMHPEPAGAFTGEISAPMLKDSGATWVILGHSERRQLFGETDEFIARKIAAAIRAELHPIACVGETLEEREAGKTLEVVERQTRAFLEELGKRPGFGVIAYEPVWAIGTGKVARPEDAQEVHAKIRELCASFSEELATSTRILYGGSVKADNAEGLLGQADVDGALVGGASLDASGFGKIIDSAERLAEAAERG
ncbi:triose-phosphate isomerase [Polyangium sp. 15x6]|nr:triose-phosphate isomerase [Polyangium sp. 15x6]MDI3288130.1 triose-phosphate isomerase [Polyangium sp. 15x6]